MEAHLMTLVDAKKALTLKKSTKSTPAHQKKRATEKSTKKHYGAFKSTHYDPCCWYVPMQPAKQKKTFGDWKGQAPPFIPEI